MSPKIPTHLICVATLPCKMSDIALKLVMTLTYCVIMLISLTCGPKTVRT